MMHASWENIRIPSSEDLRILKSASKSLAGIFYTPYMCATMKNVTYYVAVSSINDKALSKRVVGIYVALNSKGYYEIKKIVDLLPKKNTELW